MKKAKENFYDPCMNAAFIVFSAINAVVSFSIVFAMIDSAINPISAIKGTWQPDVDVDSSTGPSGKSTEFGNCSTVALVGYDPLY